MAFQMPRINLSLCPLIYCQHLPIIYLIIFLGYLLLHKPGVYSPFALKQSCKHYLSHYFFRLPSTSLILASQTWCLQSVCFKILGSHRWQSKGVIWNTGITDSRSHLFSIWNMERPFHQYVQKMADT